MFTSRHREAAGRSRVTGRGYPYRLQGFGAGPRRFRKRRCRRGGAVSGLPTEDRGCADYGPVDSFPYWGPRQRDSRRTTNEGRSMPQPQKQPTLSDAMSVLQRGTAKLWGATQLSSDERFPLFNEAYKAVIIYKVCQGVTRYKSFVQERGTCTSSWTECDTVGPRLLPVVFVRKGKKRFRMSCPNAGKWLMTDPRDGPPCP
ncbi:hypothetical protein PoB_001071500 [Plakobranchus ocellatus]|uniref:Uncharacterized protein n=1 Tax=Plakobranchus ocellatus TaxID=259542 RepID=A0AAV3YNC2_9GAST|nr:hypothetical protein PoB_001071500 [Plakobranchus ocellatus]